MNKDKARFTATVSFDVESLGEATKLLWHLNQESYEITGWHVAKQSGSNGELAADNAIDITEERRTSAWMQ